jgi:hypothetical protein
MLLTWVEENAAKVFLMVCSHFIMESLCSLINPLVLSVLVVVP